MVDGTGLPAAQSLPASSSSGGRGRPQSAGVFPSANRKLLTAATSSSAHASTRTDSASTSQRSYQTRPQSSRRPRPPSASAISGTRLRPSSNVAPPWRQSQHTAVVPAAARGVVAPQLVREEIDEQRRVTREAQRQLHELQAAQDAYKKRLRHLQDRLARDVQFLAANADLLAQRLDGARKGRTLCRSRVTLETNKHRELQRQLRELKERRSAFARNAQPVLESYREELASRSVMTERRRDADRRREELLRLVDMNPGKGARCSARSLTNAAAVARRGSSTDSRKRHSSYDVLVADADEGKRETLFAVYESQYARVLRDTGEQNLEVVLERFQSYRESMARLREIEKEQGVEGERLEREQQAHKALVSRLRLSGPIGLTDCRQRVHDRLEGARHTQRREKFEARERAAMQLKSFVCKCQTHSPSLLCVLPANALLLLTGADLQQGVLHILELLRCLDDRGGVASLPLAVLAAARGVVGVAQPAEPAVNVVASALLTIVQFAREAGRRGLQREWLKLPTLAYSMPQVERLEQFAPERQLGRGPFVNGEHDEESQTELSSSGNRASTHDAEQEEEAKDERLSMAELRRALKWQEKDTLRQAELVLRQVAETKKQHQQRKPSQPLQLQLQSDAAIVVAHFREQRRTERQELRRPPNGGTAMLTLGTASIKRKPHPPPL
ncbi:hypothetical protein BBJ28_00020613 [Nothophytophthora sp. Chile5]|nr:hypothetical protein BBJ28_00020613 [Nothophytophthora sp. Chile5]